MPADSTPALHSPFSTGRSQTITGAIGTWPSAYALGILAATVFLASLVYYGICLFPGLGGDLNDGDSAKFQILGHTSILVHGPGYPMVLLLGTGIRALALPLPPWWTLAFALAAIPGAFANAIAFLIVQRLTRNVLLGLAGALLLGSAGLMAVQATEAEVYALNLALILSTVFLLILFVETKRLGLFLAACAVYAFSFGNHLMMIMLLPLFLWTAIAHRGLVFRPLPVIAVLAFILLGASQYLYLAYIAYDPATAYSEYMPLPPEPIELIHYIMGTYFSDLYGSGLASTRTAEALLSVLRSAHPWVSVPLILAGIALFAVGWKRRDARWRGLAVLYATAASFLLFVLWYGAYDIRAFQLPVLGALLVAGVATFGWWLGARPRLVNALALLLLALGTVRAGQTGYLLATRMPLFTGVRPAIHEMVAQSPVAKPIVAMSYGVRMATLYYELLGEMPKGPVYKVRWRAVALVRDQPSVGGIVVPTDGYQFVRWIEHRRPDMACRTEKIALPEGTRWPAYSFECRTRGARQIGSAAAPVDPPGGDPR